jgi:membrane-associated protease RseP (regulator of RpoE activity)
MRIRTLILHGGLFALTALTTTAAGAIFAGIDPFASWPALARGWPFSVSLLAILLAHELGHYFMCLRHGVDASPPYFLPAPVLFGTLGAFIRVRARFPDRRALFDMGAAGPWAGFVVAVGVLVVGLRHSRVETGPAFLVFGDSLLTTWLTRLIVGADPDVVAVHPVAIAGWFGLLVTSFNLLPAGQLDGGHVVYAAFGRHVPLLSGAVAGALVWLGISTWSGWLAWAAIVALMARLGHPPTVDDRRPLGAARLVGAASSLLLFAVTFVPEPIRIVTT